MAVLDDLAQFIDTSSTAFSRSSNLGIGIALDSGSLSNTFAALYETPGQVGSLAFSTTANLAERVFDRPRVQVICRSTSYTTARTNTQTIYDLLDGVANRKLPTSTGTLYVSIEAVQAPFSLGRDENDRWLISTNYQIERDR